MPIGFARSAIARLRGALQKSAALVMNSGALATGTVATSALGFVYWWLAARLFPPDVMGVASGLLAVMSLVSVLGEGGLATLLTGELVRHPGKEPGLTAAAASVGLVLTVSLALLFVAGQALLMGSHRSIDSWFAGLTFVIGCGLGNLSILGDQAFVGILRSSRRMIRLVLFSIFKLVLLAAAAGLGFTTPTALLWTWVAGSLAAWIGVDLLTRGDARRLVGPPDFKLLLTHRRRVFNHYALDSALLTPALIMPYLVLVLLSPTTNAAFVAVWMLVSVASLIPAALAMVLFPVVRASPKQSRHDIMVSLTVSLLFSLVCAVFVFTYSQQILAVFNPAYPEIAGSSLSLLGFSLLGSTLKFHACTLARLTDRMLKAAPWFALGGALELGAAILGAKLGGLHGLVLGWTLAVSIEGIGAALWLTSATKLVANADPVLQGPTSSPLQT
ncbi:hypothetical protein JQ616_37335 [Bradyrhizobium tropiciagri]|uniref:hypothetical protein n=1 Tax=Bradyrhizobium tropiciagri TaxID=312253 RepID=UPI001BAE3303|nr:hypothetical protein [Bradyrhizobium tropiciagri]MBR0900650.1 hypothetical protein [Bradyrhizobium tropiciagri]